MDKYKEAINVIRANYPPENYTMLREGLDLAIIMLKKQIPQKGVPYNSAKNHNFVECSACNKDMDMYYKYCPHCGQRLDWS